ncbi:HD domain-containing protein [Aquimarina aquimarini]|uniref:HD domain-containing protein n=1 Tax=Aquimarina aquimarini TaxID=1191734 RepID=UPI000D559C02|nr:HD domain-containing protein [Aquimarina aquimarini]
MIEDQIISDTIDFVKDKLKGAEAGHDWFHVYRVFKNAQLISQGEKVDPLVVSIGALLHDIADSKFHDGDETVGPRIANEFLQNLQVPKDSIDHVIKIIENVSFRGGNADQKFKSLELDVIQDADRLDAIGAIGIARCFHYGGFKNRELYNPEITPDLKMSKEEYKKSTAPSINHFYEKLLLLKDRMNTVTGRRLATERHQFMEQFLEQFYKEWEGEL